MHSKANGPTKAEAKRFERIVELGCVACRKNAELRPISCEVHHLLDGGRRRGHSFTVGLCQWHHRGVVNDLIVSEATRFLGGDKKAGLKCTVDGTTAFFGPSLYHDRKAFRERYGTDDELLAYQEELLAQAEECR